MRPLLFLALLACDRDKVAVDDTGTPSWGLVERPRNTTCKAPDRPVTDASVAVERVFPSLSFSSPTGAWQPPFDDSRWYVAEKAGRLLVFDNDPSASETSTALDLRDQTNDASEGGLLGLAFHPDFPVTPYVYVSWTPSGGSTGMRSRVSRFTLDADGVTLDASSEQTLLELEQPFTNHNGGNISFGPDGHLYFGLGDGGSANDPYGNGQDTYTLLGKMLRIDVDGGAPYAIPADNPFADGLDGEPEIYATGLRNPWRFSFDRGTDELWVGDVGQNTWEEVDRVELGGNYGWSTMEGFDCFQADTCDASGLIDPIVVYQHEAREDASVTGGYVYRGSEIPALVGTYVFADLYPGSLRAIVYDEVSGEATIAEIAEGIDFYTSSFAEDVAGELYLVDYTGGRLYQIVPNPEAASVEDDFPQLLSETGCVSASDPTALAEGLIPYDVISPLWSDGLDKTRAFAIPDGSTIEIGADGLLELPVGSVVSKTFWANEAPVETRLLVRHDDGDWAGYSYAWDEEGADATLLPAGSTRDLGDHTWDFPSRSGCIRCHNGARARTLGLELGQLDRDYTYPNGVVSNQIEAMTHIGLFTSAPEDTTPLSVPNGDAPLADRAHSYLHANCAHCHVPDGPALGGLDLRVDASDTDRGWCKSPENGDLGVEDAQVLAPGAPERSVLALRMRAMDTHRMPSLGSAVLDDDGIALIEAWIEALPPCP